MAETVIEIHKLSKLYRLGQVGSGTLRNDLHRWWQMARGKEDPFLKLGQENIRDQKGSEFVWALKDISFEVCKGEVLGIIGKNGAGKSTLLKILSRVTSPTTGYFKAKGRIASLLEVGTGFHPELSGRDNIFLNGAILGMTKNEIKRKFDAIVDFAGVERYIDTPVKRYSSGMYVRLAFAVAAYLESEILIVDEVLAVGDMEFQKKCIGKMNEVSESEGRTVLFVSHNMGTLISLCKHGIIMQNGTVVYNGSMQDAISNYSAMQATTGEDSPYLDCSKYTNPEISLNFLQIKGQDNKLSNNFLSDSAVLVELNYQLSSTVNNLRIIIALKTIEGFNIFETADVLAAGRGVRQQGCFSSILKIPAHFLNVGKYIIEVTVDKPGEKELFGSILLGFNITELMECQIGITMSRPMGVIHPKLDWQIIQNQ